MLVINVNNGNVKTVNKKDFILSWSHNDDYSEALENAADCGFYAFPNKKAAVEWLLTDIPYYLDFSPERCKRLYKALTSLLGFQVLEVK